MQSLADDVNPDRVFGAGKEREETTPMKDRRCDGNRRYLLDVKELRRGSESCESTVRAMHGRDRP